MKQRYGLIVCASELLLRNEIFARISDGWELAPSFRIPSTVASGALIGKDANPPNDDTLEMGAPSLESDEVVSSNWDGPSAETIVGRENSVVHTHL